ncbi:MAG: LemA family protein [Bacteroidales bacterium]|nr:LemA family protein [Bacteroidales bacterium]
MIYAIGVLVILFLLIIGLYNSLVRRKNDVENAFASVDVMLKKRYDLIPNLVETVKNYMKHEKSLLTELTALRAQAVSGEISDDERIALENKITGGISGIMVAVENYPDLKASQNFLQLQAAWNEAEEQISASRRAFNAAVTSLNNKVETFPSNVMAGIMGYKRRTLFEIPEVERKNMNAKNLFES